MSSQTDADNSERPFQLVQKRSSTQGRRGMIRERPPHSKPQAQEDPPARNKRQYQKQEREPRARSHSHGSHAPRSTHPSSSSHVQRQDPPPSKGGSNKEGEGHRSAKEHSWENELRPNGDKNVTPAKNRYERLSISETTTYTSNRFEGLNPDSEAPGGDNREGFTEREKKPRGLRGRSHSGSKSPTRKGSREEELVRSHSSEKLEESSKGEIKELESPIECSEVELHEEKQDDKVDNIAVSKSQETSANETETSEKSKAETSRHRYSREELLKLKDNTYSKNTVPKGLKEEYFREGKWCAEAWLTPQQQDEELQDETRASGKHPTALSLIREHDLKHVGKVCLSPQRRSFGMGCSWKEMSSGSSRTPSATPTSNDKSDILAEERDDLFLDMEGPHPPPQGPRPPPTPNYPPAPPFQAPPPPSPHGHIPPPRPHPPHVHTPRVINHVPLRDRERKNWREKEHKAGWRRQGQAAEDEDEPEWMAFGPSDRSEVIELKGLEEHEREREARLDSDKPNGEIEESGDEDTPPPRPQGESIESEEGGGEGVLEVNRKRSSPLPQDSVEIEEEGMPEVPQVPEVKVGGVREVEEENEFILDGFDFSTGLSICQELASEDTEDPDPLPSQVNNPAELSNALMKVLKVGDRPPHHNRGPISMGSRPANALTLEEIQARENIQSSQPQMTDHDQSAFNKLVAVLQSSGAIQEQKPQKPSKAPKTSHSHVNQPPETTRSQPPMIQPSELPRSRPHSHHGQQQMKLPPPIGPPPPERKPNFGYLLEKELNFDDDIGPPPSFSTSTPYSAREASHQQMRNRMEMQPSSSRSQTYHGLTHSANTLATATPQQMARDHPSLQENWMDELGGAWVYPETLPSSANIPTSLRQMNSSLHDHPSLHSHQLAAQRQHQQMATAAANRQSSNHWAVEMEQRRLMELQHIRERERMLAARGQQYLSQQKPSASKPNISLLPTAVMKHMYNTKPNQSLSELSKSHGSSSVMGSHSVMANRLDQELTSKASQTHSAISSLLNHSDGGGGRDYLPPSTLGSSRVGGPPPSSRYYDPGFYHQQFMTPMPHGIPAQQNPYMH